MDHSFQSRHVCSPPPSLSLEEEGLIIHALLTCLDRKGGMALTHSLRFDGGRRRRRHSSCAEGFFSCSASPPCTRVTNDLQCITCERTKDGLVRPLFPGEFAFCVVYHWLVTRWCPFLLSFFVGPVEYFIVFSQNFFVPSWTLHLCLHSAAVAASFSEVQDSWRQTSLNKD